MGLSERMIKNSLKESGILAYFFVFSRDKIIFGNFFASKNSKTPVLGAHKKNFAKNILENEYFQKIFHNRKEMDIKKPPKKILGGYNIL